MASVVEDVASASNVHHFQVQSYDISLVLDLDKQHACGSVKVQVNRTQEASKTLILDSYHLNIHRVTVCSSNETLPFKIEPFTGFGSALHIDTKTVEGNSFELEIEYSTGNEGPAICWLNPEQTAGKKYPYLFTQGQACLNRSLFPCQDTPSIKVTFSTELVVPKPLVPVCSAEMQNEIEGNRLMGAPVPDELTKYLPAGKSANDFHSFRASLPQGIRVPSYLVAFAVGDISCASIGPRSKVWTEPSVLESAKNEFDGITEKYLSVGENLWGEYRWKKYDLLVMPPCFPFGGMENPLLTFVTPCLICGDQSLCDVVAHEITHSWFGNLVTNASWSDFWLNEGFTMYGQRRITEEVHGIPFTALEATTGVQLLKEEMKHLPADSPLTRLHVPLDKGVDPEDTYNETPYEKGYMFVSYLARCAGSTENFDKFLRHYCDTFAFQSVTPQNLFDLFFEYFPHLRGIENKEGYEFDKWLNSPGWAPYEPDLSSAKELTEPVDHLIEDWRDVATAVSSLEKKDEYENLVSSPSEQCVHALIGKLPDEANVKFGKCQSVKVNAWPTYQQMHFLDRLLSEAESSVLNLATLSLLDHCYNFSNSANPEIRQRWSTISGSLGYIAVFDSIRKFLESQGKQKYTLPVYRALVKTERGKAFAEKVFTDTKAKLHVNVRNYVQKILSKN